MSGPRRTGGEEGRLVYSSARGATPDPKPPRGTPAPAPGGPVRVGRSRQGRRGKPVTTVSGLPLREPELRALAAELKRRLGSGGSVVGGVIEIQGDHRDALVDELAARGYRAVRSGG